MLLIGSLVKFGNAAPTNSRGFYAFSVDIDEWMDGWIDGQIDGWMDGCCNENS